jgi:hypothetical protein
MRFIGLDRTLDLTRGDHVEVTFAEAVPHSIAAIMTTGDLDMPVAP